MNLIGSLFHSIDHYIVLYPEGFMKIWDLKNRKFIEDTIEKSRNILFLSTSICEYSLIDSKIDPNKKADMEEFINWHYKREYFMESPKVDWIVTETGKILCFGCEEKVLLEKRKILSEKGITLERVDGILTLLINAGRKASESNKKFLVILTDFEDVSIMGFCDGRIEFLRSFKSYGFDSLDKEILSTITYFQFSPQKKIEFFTGENEQRENSYYLFNDFIFKDIIDEKLPL